ncbi:MAG: MerR family transcriptional regulator [Phycisphaerae bacterium]
MPPNPVPPKLYRIGEIADFCGISRQTVHNYTMMGLIRETKWTDGGHRLYDESVFYRLHQIAHMKRDMPLSDIQRELCGGNALE